LLCHFAVLFLHFAFQVGFDIWNLFGAATKAKIEQPENMKGGKKK